MLAARFPPPGVSNAARAAYNSGMANSIWTTEEFTCPGCGLNYTATKEDQPSKRSGSFACMVCEAEVHAWSGRHDYFDWTAVKMRSPIFGRR
jgi:hypothetical protein